MDLMRGWVFLSCIGKWGAGKTIAGGKRKKIPISNKTFLYPKWGRSFPWASVKMQHLYVLQSLNEFAILGQWSWDMDLYRHEWLLDRKFHGYLNQLSPEDETWGWQLAPMTSCENRSISHFFYFYFCSNIDIFYLLFIANFISTAKWDTSD